MIYEHPNLYYCFPQSNLIFTRIINNELNDIQAIFKLYEDCTAYQKLNFKDIAHI